MFEQPSAYHYYTTEDAQYKISNLMLFNKTKEIQHCLNSCYDINEISVREIIIKLQPLIENFEHHMVLDEFIEKSQELKIQFLQQGEEYILQNDDAVLRAPQWHEVIFESPFVRVLWGESNPGDKEPYHTHRWKSLMIITHPGTFEIKNANGDIEKDLWPIGVYELCAETSSSTYTNVGTSTFKALRFEIKD